MTSCVEDSIDNSDIISCKEGISDRLSEEILWEETTCEKHQEIQETTRSHDVNDLILESKKLIYPADAARVLNNMMEKDVNYSVSQGAIHQHKLQQKRGYSSKVLQHLPLEIGFVCLLIALISSVLWYLEALTLLQRS